MPLLTRSRDREHPGVRSRFWLWAGAVVLLAFLIREYFVLAAIVEIPIRGDIREYVLYAWNLVHHGVFSMTAPQDIAPSPDAYRSPGFPWLLALCMWLRPEGDGWYSLALQMQVLLGTATVWFTLLLARRWLRQGWALLAGVMIAVWPHHIAATGALLSEVAFGCALIAGLYCFAKALELERIGWLALAALVFGAAYLVNPLIALFPPLLAWLLWRAQGRRSSLLFLAIFLIPVLGLGLRNASIDSLQNPHRMGRVAMNFVQGSWPQYHEAWKAQSLPTIHGISDEMALLDKNPCAGLSRVATRMAAAPGDYAAWYLWRKPMLLWDWEIRIGNGGPYVLDVRHSPLDTNALLRACSIILETLNPLLTLLALGGIAWLLMYGWRRGPQMPAAAIATAYLALYLTLIHTALQAEPRYANAYRAIEVLLVATFLQLLVDRIAGRMHRSQPPAA